MFQGSICTTFSIDHYIVVVVVVITLFRLFLLYNATQGFFISCSSTLGHLVAFLRRLFGIRLLLPKLSDRRGDIPLLANHFLDAASRELGGEPKLISKEAMEYLATLNWPGNVRQLENTCRWLTVMASGREIGLADLPPDLLGADAPATTGGSWQQLLALWASERLQSASANEPVLEEAVPIFERTMIEAALAQTSGRKRDAAVLLGWGRNTLTRKIKELGMTDST